MQIGIYPVYIQKKYTRIGCEYHSNEDWIKWSPEDVKDMDTHASDWWEKHKAIVVAAINILSNQEENIKTYLSSP
jgi:hypothetical protein